MKLFVIALGMLVVGCLATSAQATISWYDFSFSAADVMSYSYANGAVGTGAAENSLYDGARLVRLPGSYQRSYVGAQQSAFTNWATTTTDRLTTINLWGFDGLGAGWGEDYKHMDRTVMSNPSGWTEWTDVGWGAGWGANPNPNTAVTPAWIIDNLDPGFGLGFADGHLASQAFNFRLKFDDANWRYGHETHGAPNTLGGPMTFWFGGWMGDAANPFKYIYEGNMVLQGSEVPEPSTMVLLAAAGLLGLGVRRLRRK
jgi:hypothetical protein